MFLPTPSELFFSKNDLKDPRLGELFKNYETEPQNLDYMIFGYPDDEGIRLNGGRPGSALAPNLIRQFLYKMTPAESFYLNRKNKFKYTKISIF